ncbi:spermatogenesis associated 2-like [Cyprinodon tularosa]|uniref:spermatogenesis associated 2-like n=1 Tax=Cyprinodon tularosa TaxID=77115 RepID=UPI0018E26C53|nr:spermatogenesis associated 2-like [Cyprinodon tularosa]XP_038149945.1 spermatogenesis associated 2-like [Cyprinodon tularosa]
MCALRQRAADLVRAYDQMLEQQILGRGSSLACKDETLCQEVEGLLKDSDPREVHCLGLDPLRVMEESLKVGAAAAPSGAYGRSRKSRRGLQGLAIAFEVLEQAALNLYLGPWRNEYKVIKMYSGTFTHCISPVLSMPQTETLFGLLGYRPSPAQQLCLQSPRVSPASLEDLLRMSCAFFVARCECRLLLGALGKRVGDTQYELAVVKERQRGHVLQVAVDNTEMQLSVKQPAGMEQIDVEVDMYRDEQINGGQEDFMSDDEDPPTSTRDYQDNLTPPGAHRPRNGPISPGSRSKPSYEDPRFDHLGSKEMGVPGRDRVKTDVGSLCDCVGDRPLRLHRCFDCNAFHDITCLLLAECRVQGHRIQTVEESADDPTQSRHLKVPDGLSSGVPAVSTIGHHSAASESPKVEPISYHCDSAKVDPRLLCHTCKVFHGSQCVQGKLCRTSHNTIPLGTCSCGKFCNRKPLVLCHYCGNEYCSQCWYKNPVTCSCGQTFDLSTSV